MGVVGALSCLVLSPVLLAYLGKKTSPVLEVLRSLHPSMSFVQVATPSRRMVHVAVFPRLHIVFVTDGATAKLDADALSALCQLEAFDPEPLSEPLNRALLSVALGASLFAIVKALASALAGLQPHHEQWLPITSRRPLSPSIHARLFSLGYDPGPAKYGLGK